MKQVSIQQPTIDAHTGQQQLLGEDAHIQQAAANLARFLAQWPEPADTNQLMHGLTLVPPLLKTLDNKKCACATKQSAMELLGQLALFSDAYRTDIVTQGGVAALVRQLRCEQPGCQKAALLAVHRLLVMSKQRTTLLGHPVDDEVLPYCTLFVQQCAVPHLQQRNAYTHCLHSTQQQEEAAPAEPESEPKKSTKLGRLTPSLSSLKDRSKLTRSLTRLVRGLSVTDLHQQVCDAGAMEMVIAMVRGDQVARQLAADVLLDVAAHQGRVHHLAKRGAVQVRCGRLLRALSSCICV